MLICTIGWCLFLVFDFFQTQKGSITKKNHIKKVSDEFN